MSSKHNDPAQAFLRRKEKNLNYFKVRLPRIYQVLENMMLTRAELVVTPGANDVDMTIDGKSLYRGLAKEFAEDEVRDFLQENGPEKPLKTFAPVWSEACQKDRFASLKLRDILDHSPVTRENFSGYQRDNIYPSIVFLGCGLGYHIEAMVERANIANAIIVEREPEKFALSLFTVDWAKICSKFQRKGCSLNFAIGLATSEVSMRDLLGRNLTANVPFHPFTTIYYNHFADIELAKVAADVSKDIALIPASWSNYDDEVMRLKNALHNNRQGINYIQRKQRPALNKPLVVVGSGPSLDRRIAKLAEHRDEVVIMSAGTGIRPLLAAGIKPDIHVELDPSHILYDMHSDFGADKLEGITLLAVNEINPFVPRLFGRTFYYFKTDNAIPGLVGVADKTFPSCNPTCTNAAVSIGHSLGFHRIFLFGTDYGFESADKDHSEQSVYGEEAKSEFARTLQTAVAKTKRMVYRVPGAAGGEVLTRGDYYSSKRTVEKLIAEVKSKAADTEVFNCSDGAAIEGTQWLSQEEFVGRIDQGQGEESLDVLALLSEAEAVLPENALDQAMPAVVQELRRDAGRFAKILKGGRLGGRKDLVLLANELRGAVNALKPRPGAVGLSAAQLYASQLIKGTVLYFVHVGLSHGLACSDGELAAFLALWRKDMLAFLEQLPGHFEQVALDVQPVDQDPWARLAFHSPEPGLELASAESE